MDTKSLIIIYLVVITVVFVAAMVIIIINNFIKKKKKDKGIGTNTGKVIENNGISKSPMQIVNNNTLKSQTPLEAVNSFFNQTKKQYDDGYNDALQDNAIENGIVRIKSDGKELCGIAKLAYEKKIEDLDFEIAYENSIMKGASEESMQAKKKTAEKKNIEKDIEYIKEKEKSLENEKDLGIYVSYRSGFVKGREDKNK